MAGSHLFFYQNNFGSSLTRGGQFFGIWPGDIAEQYNNKCTRLQLKP